VFGLLKSMFFQIHLLQNNNKKDGKNLLPKKNRSKASDPNRCGMRAKKRPGEKRREKDQEEKSSPEPGRLDKTQLGGRRSSFQSSWSQAQISFRVDSTPPSEDPRPKHPSADVRTTDGKNANDRRERASDESGSDRSDPRPNLTRTKPAITVANSRRKHIGKISTIFLPSTSVINYTND